jgi:hypothetical protein
MIPGLYSQRLLSNSQTVFKRIELNARFRRSPSCPHGLDMYQNRSVII